MRIDREPGRDHPPKSIQARYGMSGSNHRSIRRVLPWPAITRNHPDHFHADEDAGHATAVLCLMARNCLTGRLSRGMIAWDVRDMTRVMTSASGLIDAFPSTPPDPHCRQAALINIWGACGGKVARRAGAWTTAWSGAGAGLLPAALIKGSKRSDSLEDKSRMVT
jgi:hypothetical protein